MKNNLIRKLYTIIKTAALLPIYKSYVRPHLDYSHQTFVLMNLRLQDVLIKTNIFSLVIRLGQDQYIRLGYTSRRRLQDVFKASCKSIFKTSSRPLAKTSSTCFQDLSSSLTVLVNKSSRSIYCKDGYLQKDLPR